ncbi:MAG: hypothetical protein KGD59_13665 [Candidatus Heimdallarchaeota archaeon]|nr:hypothetical protein [Candidatus Heimdallarchaeota archaeon]MBY8995592.1 hypothetical protein [Candidatus Heimdallarchaeota archaeon]
MSKNPDDISFEIINSENKLIFLVGVIKDFTAYNFATDYNYSYLDFNSFLIENKIDSQHFKKDDALRTTRINISIDHWTQKVTYREQKGTIIIDGFDPLKIPDLLTRSLLMQELLHLSRNSAKLKTHLVFVIDLKNGALEEQILPKILANGHIINVD